MIKSRKEIMLEKRIAKLEKKLFENSNERNLAIRQLKDYLACELKSPWGKDNLSRLREEILTGHKKDKHSAFNDLCLDGFWDESDYMEEAYEYYKTKCRDIYNCEELDDDLLTLIYELLG